MKIREIFINFGVKNYEIAQTKVNKRKMCRKNLKNFDEVLLNFRDWSGAKESKSCRSRKMLQNASFLAIVAVDTADNEPSKVSLK